LNQRACGPIKRVKTIAPQEKSFGIVPNAEKEKPLFIGQGRKSRERSQCRISKIPFKRKILRAWQAQANFKDFQSKPL
jgi:hypothetical protein